MKTKRTETNYHLVCRILVEEDLDVTTPLLVCTLRFPEALVSIAIALLKDTTQGAPNAISQGVL